MPVKEQEPRITIKDVARHAGVSKSTVSKVFNQDNYGTAISEETRQKVFAVARQLNYAPNRLAQSLATRKSNIIGVSMERNDFMETNEQSIYSMFMMNILFGIDKAVRPYNNDILLIFRNKFHGQTNIREFYKLDLISGLIYFSPSVDCDDYYQIAKMGIPIVLVGRSAFDINIHRVDIDNLHEAWKLTRYLINNRHTRIAFICDDTSELTYVSDQVKGYQQALAETGLPWNSAYEHYGMRSRQDGRKVAQSLLGLASPPTAAICVSSEASLGFSDVLREKNVRLPDDFSLIAFNDIPALESAKPAISALRTPSFNLSYLATQNLIKLIEHPTLTLPNVILESDLIIRETSG